VALACPAPGAAGGGPIEGAPDFRVYFTGAADVAVVKRALANVRSRLSSPSCQGVFTEFEGSDGRPLTAVLQALGQTGVSYLDLLSFYDGGAAAPCQSRQLPILAFTAPGSRVIFICPRFVDMHRRYSREAEATLIHESLHSLGLGENPPSSRYIQDRVLERCGHLPTP
jgi:hypothetical protein